MRRLEGKRVIVTDPTEYNGSDIVALSRPDQQTLRREFVGLQA